MRAQIARSLEMVVETLSAERVHKTGAMSHVCVATQFARENWLRVVAVSGLLLLPCFWHRRIEAGDLGSHVYNAWLAQLIAKGQAPGLYISRRWSNVLFDLALVTLGNRLGLAAAEKIAVSASVLLFFWGTFALLSAVTQRAPWFLLPCLAMLAYGWTFNMGFFNFYLSLGLGFLATAILWRAVSEAGEERVGLGQGRARVSAVDLAIALVLSALVLVAHPQGFVWMVGCLVYVLLWTRLRGAFKLLIPGAAVAVIVAAAWYLPRHYTSYTVWDDYGAGLYNGVDQLALYGMKFRVLAGAALAFGILCFVMDAVGRKAWAPLRPPLELYLVAVVATYLLPDSIRLPLYPGWVGFQALRLTTMSAAMGLCVLGFMRRKRWHSLGFAAIALLFFAFLYQATGTLNRMEAQIERLVAGLPPGERVTATIWAAPDSRIPNVVHMADRACIGKCFSFQNYEAASGEFRVRVRQNSRIVSADPAFNEQMEAGEYLVKPEDLPMVHIYQCDAADLTRLCLRQLSAGELNGRLGYHRVR